jgi:methanogenic corrinoid protein MtbC1
LRDDVIQRQLSDAILRGDSETAEAKAKVLAQYAKNPTEALDDLYDAYSTVESLHALGEYDDARFASSANAARASLSVLKSSLTPRQTRFTSKICVGPVSGGNDVMSSIMAAMFTASGHQVTDLSRSATPREVLRNAEQSNAELLVVSFNEETSGLAKEFVHEYESGGFRGKFDVVAFLRGSQAASVVSSSFAFVAHDPLELLSKVTEFLIRRRGSARDRSSE